VAAAATARNQRSASSAGAFGLHQFTYGGVSGGTVASATGGDSGGFGVVGRPGSGSGSLPDSYAGGRPALPPSPVAAAPAVPSGVPAVADGRLLSEEGLYRTRSGGGAASAPGWACAPPPYSGPCCWHEIQANLVLDPVTAEWNLVIICHDVTSYVQAELEVREVLDAEVS
jgi:hypothetical protein